MNTVKIEGLYDRAYRARTGTSFSPEKRAKSIVEGHEAELNEDLQNIPEHEKARYIEGYKKHLFAWLAAGSNCISSMIAGPSNFPVRRAEKANAVEHKRSVEFIEWREKALKAIARKVEESKPIEQKQNERWEQIKKNLESSLATVAAIDEGKYCGSRQLFVASITGTVKTLAKKADNEMVIRCLNLIDHWNSQFRKPIITPKNSIWNLLTVAETNREKEADRQSAESEETIINDIRMVKNFQADRLQLFFDGKPAPEVISTLKKNAFKWSPTNTCWQRQLTQNAVYAAQSILK